MFWFLNQLSLVVEKNSTLLQFQIYQNGIIIILTIYEIFRTVLILIYAKYLWNETSIYPSLIPFIHLSVCLFALQEITGACSNSSCKINEKCQLKSLQQFTCAISGNIFLVYFFSNQKSISYIVALIFFS